MTVSDGKKTIRDTKHDSSWQNMTIRDKNMTIRDTRNDNPWNKTWQSVTQNMTIRGTKHDNLWQKRENPWHKTTKLFLPKMYITRKWDLFPSYMNILKYPSIHHMRYFCLSVGLSDFQQAADTFPLCFPYHPPPLLHPTPTFVLITCFRFRSSWICYVSNLKILKL